MKIKTLYKKIKTIEEKYKKSLNLIANENMVSAYVHEISNSLLSYKYNFWETEDGLFVSGWFCMKAMNEFDDFITEWKNILKRRLSAEHIFINCLSWSHAMMSSLLLLTNPGDTIMTVPSSQWWHFLTNNILKTTWRKQIDTVYNYEELNFDPIWIWKIVKEFNVKCIYFDLSTQLNTIPIKKIRKEIWDDVIIICDLSHTLWLVLWNVITSPLLEWADIVTWNTHKTLPWTHKWIIAFKDKNIWIDIEKKILITTMSTNHTWLTLWLCWCIIEIDKYIEKYSKRIVKVANKLWNFFEKEWFIVRKTNNWRYTENHQIHIFLPDNIKHTDAIKNLIQSWIYTSTSRSLSTSRDKYFLRIWVQEIVYKNFKDCDIELIPGLVKRSIFWTNQLKNVMNMMEKYPVFITYK